MAKKTTAARLFSSGTTGLSKAGTLSHYDLIAQHCQINEWRPNPYDVSTVQPPLNIVPSTHASQERCTWTLPFFHVVTVPLVHFSPSNNRVQTYVLRRFDVAAFLSSIERYQITDLGLVPPVIASIIMSEKRHKYSMKSVKFATWGAAPLEKGPQARLKHLLAKGAPFTQAFTQVWGMTETIEIVLSFLSPENDDTGSVGRPLPGMDLRLVDDEGRDITDFDVRCACADPSLFAAISTRRPRPPAGTRTASSTPVTWLIALARSGGGLSSTVRKSSSKSADSRSRRWSLRLYYSRTSLSSMRRCWRETCAG